MHAIIVNIVYLINIYDLRVNKCIIGRQISTIFVYRLYTISWNRKKILKLIDELSIKSEYYFKSLYDWLFLYNNVILADQEENIK